MWSNKNFGRFLSVPLIANLFLGFLGWWVTFVETGLDIFRDEKAKEDYKNSF